MDDKIIITAKPSKILFQISYDEDEDIYKYIANEMTNQEFMAFLMFLKLCCDRFEYQMANEMWGNNKEDDTNN